MTLLHGDSTCMFRYIRGICDMALLHVDKQCIAPCSLHLFHQHSRHQHSRQTDQLICAKRAVACQALQSADIVQMGVLMHLIVSSIISTLKSHALH